MSLQNLLLSYGLRKKLKRGPPPEHIDIPATRRAMSQFGHQARVPSGWRIGASTAPDLPGEWTRPLLDVHGNGSVAIDGASEATCIATGDDDIAAHDVAVHIDMPTIFYLHGGGYYFCSPQTHRPLTLALAEKSGVQLFSLDYRLAPEHPHPAALDDALTAYRALLARGTSAANIVIAGDSAGGGLALATLIALQREGSPMPAGALLFSPWTDLAATGETLRTNDRSDVMFHGESVARAARFYLGDIPATNPLVSPLYASEAEMAALPPLFVQASDREVLLDDSRRLVDRVRAAGGEAELRIWRRVPHVWQIYHPFLPEARRALDEAARFVRNRFSAAVTQ
ncbi:alpha/beta hydrolase [Cupriavidus plantarum]|uniref:alpha/beta hydrolase n=1 Tax=Cupriavidus plantarum TaxID=942865 RepID=UPI0015C99F7B|nr:alpha/beta hydrolase [Cupriavidus plantarum]NYH97309.1 acetyl esterase/lipase [Cupriavidus plantarum]